MKQSKITDVRKLVEKYVPQEFHQFYSLIAGDEEVSSETRRVKRTDCIDTQMFLYL